jgi:hypothetical protein
MADSVVTVLLDYLSGLLKEEANFLDGVEDKVSSLHGELRLINIFLKNSEGKRNDEIVKEIVRQIREVAYEAEDVIDTFIFKVAEHRRRSRIGRIFRLPSHTKMLRTVGRKITNIQEKINKIYNNKERYGIERVEATENAVEEEAMHRRRREVEEDDVVGFVDDTATLVKQLTDGDRKLSVISIIGMGGLGKTTLARKLYNNLHVQRHFNCHVWVCVSQDFRTRELLLTISKVLGIEKPKDKSTDDELRSEFTDDCELPKYLKGKRYLVVMDDIWRTEVWDEVSSAFPNNSNGSRILITSRNKEVALHASPSLDPYSLPFLNHSESWELFRKKVFRGEICPPELESLGKQIAEGCRGLPLSIVVLAGILANKEKSVHMWSKFVGHVTSFLTHEEDTTICQKILSLSYTDLPRRLKPCFLYFGMYPEDFEIPVRQLMHLWVAEGFLQHTGHRYPEDVAELYLGELIDRSLIQVASKRTDGGVKKCRIHDLLRELCISEGAEETFLEVHSAYHLSSNKSRRLSIQGDPRQYMSLNPSVTTYARSLFLFGEGNKIPFVWNWLLKNFRLVRVLNFWRVQHSVVGKRVGTFIHLRYLAIEISAGTVFPDSIDNLMNLETLYVSGHLKEGCMPKGIFKLLRLRNLYIGL